MLRQLYFGALDMELHSRYLKKSEVLSTKQLFLNIGLSCDDVFPSKASFQI